ncbi:MAG TPA: DegV family protein [Candidatus Ruthenibacterium merdavium]|uniref:DegV family protein n=1 Tax=Candidatus Ruthenibacterium merdavium TaxID=2838752 RepID=A0A9D2TK55_9FIRM|nr:DegV family protein [Candidatus Ruthenibacterium merdavium]
MPIQLIADSCCDVTPAMKRLLGLSIASLNITVGEEHYRDDESLNTLALIAKMKACKTPPTTACPTPEEYAALMRQERESFVITLSSKLSGSYNAACVGRQLALEENPDLRIHVFDSESAAAGETRIALFLRDLIDAGMDFDSIVEKTTASIATMKTHFVLEDLSHLVKNGRISKAAGLLGTMLNIRPIMGENGHGEIIPLEKVRGTANAMRRLVEIVASETAQAAGLTLVLSYCNCLERAQELKKMFLSQCSAIKEVIMVPTNGISTVYADDGGIVVAF